MSSLITSGQNLLVDRYPFTETPKTKPVSDGVLKSHLLVNHSSDDTLLDTLIWAAVEEVEARGNVALINQQRRQYLGPDAFDLADETIALSQLPIVSVSGVYYLDNDGVQQTLASSKYRVTRSGVLFGTDLPTMVSGPDKLWIDYVAGYGTNAGAVPAAWQHCVMYLTMHKYEMRGDDPGKYSAEWERAFNHLILVAGGSLRGY